MAYSIAIGILVSYLLGNLNGAVCVSALMHDDVREHGSGNAGLTNFIRNYGNGRALYVVAIDAGKAFLASIVCGLLLKPYGLELEGKMIGGFAVLLGHVFPAVLGFKGGKGVLSGLFIALAVDWRIFLMILAVFFLAYFTTRFVSLGSVLGSVAFGAGFLLWHRDNLPVLALGLIMGALAVFMHRGNIRKLLQGKERRTHLFRNLNEKEE